jgi:hypothetical protein
VARSSGMNRRVPSGKPSGKPSGSGIAPGETVVPPGSLEKLGTRRRRYPGHRPKTTEQSATARKEGREAQ